MKCLIIVLTGIIIFLPSCKQTYTPKPRGYFRIDLPEKDYVHFDEGLAFCFDYPDYATIERYTGRFETNPDAENWLNIDFPNFSAHIHLTYKTIRNDLGKLIEDAHNFAYKHTIKADAINQIRFGHPQKSVFGVKFEIKGNTASNLQFYCTDSVNNFLRGALYFDTEPNKDSLAPVVQFLGEDLDKLIESLEWQNSKTN